MDTDAKGPDATPRLEIIGVTGLPEISAGARLGQDIADACVSQGTPIADGDVLVVTQKIVSKAEGRTVRLSLIEPSPLATSFAETSGRDPRLVELVLRESRSIVRMDPERGVMITETHHGFVCANAGIDASNVPGDDYVTLLPEDSDASARRILDEVVEATSRTGVAVVVSDTFGRAWREGQVNFAIGAAGIAPFRDYRGEPDAVGKMMTVTQIADIDELAASGELVMGKTAEVPVAIVRGHRFSRGEDGYRPLLRPRASDLFR
jgi:coenzyme F420-0:L-glutamate ligase/coenzyme F420-1:gamma-L-glutamate ligase